MRLCAAILAALLLAVPLSSQTATAQSMSFGEATEVWADACTSDINRHCKGVRPGGDRLTACLAENAGPACSAATRLFQENRNARLAAQANARDACLVDVRRLCSNFREGQARILRCLMRDENFRRVSNKCRETLDTAGWLDTISVRAN